MFNALLEVSVVCTMKINVARQVIAIIDVNTAFPLVPIIVGSRQGICVYALLKIRLYFHFLQLRWNSWSLQHNVSYEGAIGSTGQTKTLIELLRLLKLPFRIQHHPFKNCRLLASSNYRSDHWIFMNPFIKQRSNAIYVKTNRTIVVHVRRGDVNMNYPQTGDYFRYIPNSYFLDLLENIRKPNDHVIILSQRTESFADFVNAGYDVQLDTSVVQAWKTMIESDIFIMSRS
jgi:hypothetical protein